MACEFEVRLEILVRGIDKTSRRALRISIVL